MSSKVLFIILLIILAIVSGFLSNVHKNMKVTSDGEQRAYDLIEDALIAGWVVFVTILIYLVVTITFSEKVPKSLKDKEFFFTLILVVLLFIMGVLSGIAANEIKNGPNYPDPNKTYYGYCAWVAAIILGISALLILWAIYMTFIKDDSGSGSSKECKKEVDSLSSQNEKLKNDYTKLKKEYDNLKKTNVSGSTTSI